MLFQRTRRWPNIAPTMGERLVLSWRASRDLWILVDQSLGAVDKGRLPLNATFLTS